MRALTLGVLIAALAAASPHPTLAGEKPRLETALSGPLVGYPLPLWMEESLEPRAGGPSFEDQVMELVNQERWDNGQLPPLKRVSLLDSSSETQSSNMGSRNFFSHCDLDTLTQPWDRMSAAGYSGMLFAAENIAAGYSTPQAVMNGWMASTGHRANILSTSSWELGIGYVLDGSDTGNVRLNLNTDCVVDQLNQGPYYHYWTQNFGRRSGVYPVVIGREAYETTTRDVDLYLYGTGFAVSMRLRNENGAWTAWQSFAADVAWQLSAGNGTKTVNVEIASGAAGTGTVRSASDTILLNGATDIFTDGFESGNTSAWNSTVP